MYAKRRVIKRLFVNMLAISQVPGVLKKISVDDKKDEVSIVENVPPPISPIRDSPYFENRLSPNNDNADLDRPEVHNSTDRRQTRQQ